MQRFVTILFELLVQPKVLERCSILDQFSRILLKEDDDHTDDDDDGDDDVAAADDDVDDNDDTDDNDDNDPVKLFQKRCKWWELIV